MFNCDIKQIQWEDYFDRYSQGLRRYINKDPDDTIELAQQRYTKLGYAHKAILLLYYTMITLGLYGFLKVTGILDMAMSYLNKF